MIRLYRKIENLWFKLPQQLRFLLVGGFNTLLAYLLFVVFVTATPLSYQAAVVVQYVITVNLSILTMRYYVFRAQGPFMREYVRALGVYLFMLAVNYAYLRAVVEPGVLTPVPAQGIYTVLSTLLIYLLHRSVSFRDRQ